MKKALITGIKGFTGQYVAEELTAHDWDVWGLGIYEVAGEEKYQQVDLSHPEDLQQAVDRVQADAVIHLAAISFVGHGDANDFYKVNLMGTRNLLSALARCVKPPECVVLASSANIYGNTTEGMLSETDPPNPVNDYSVSKLAMEYMARLWMGQLPIVMTRPFNYTGVGQSESFLLPKIVAHFQRGAAEIELGNLDVWRDFSDVRAVATAYRRLLEVRPVGETVNICSGRTHSLREVMDMAEKISGRPMEIRVNPKFVRSNEVRTLFGDASKLRRLIGQWNPPTLDETLGWMLAANSR